MSKKVYQQGFSLAEMAIVLVIVGLIAGALTVAARMRTNAAVTATIRDVNALGAATAIFLDRFGGLPGDLVDAEHRVPGCAASSAACTGAPHASAGDGNVGHAGWVTRHQTSTDGSAARETVLFWTHLALADLISGVSLAGGTTPTLAWGVSHPAAAIGGGFHAKDADGGITEPLPGWPPAAQQPSGTYLVLQPFVTRDLTPARPSEGVLTPTEAAWIDRKTDDGNPFKGSTIAYGAPSLLFTGGGCLAWTAIDRGTYGEDRDSRDCGLAFRIAP